VALAKRSANALKKVHSRTLDDGSDTQSFHSSLTDLSSIVRNTCRRKGRVGEPRFIITRTPSAKQKQALGLTDTLVV